MSLASMTGFARAHGQSGAYAWAWEIKSVNSKSLDLRLRLPPGWDAIEVPARARAAKSLSRGAVTANLEVKRNGMAPVMRVNEEVLAAVLETIKSVARRVEAQPPTLDGILSMRGVVELADPEESMEDRERAESAVIAGFDQAIADLVVARRSEGTALTRVIEERVARIAELVAAAEANPARTPDAIRARIAEQVEALLDTGQKFDPDRLHQEALLIATRADIREELDRLHAHVDAARAMLKAGGTVGRRLDFLAQEFNREANTLCAKANDASLTAIGLDLKTVVDQLREQVQNLE